MRSLPGSGLRAGTHPGRSECDMTRILAAFLALMLLSAVAASAYSGKNPTEFENFTLSGSLSQEQQNDLGVTSPFRVSEIGSELLLVEIFSMYCPICQMEAKYLNELSEQIKADGYGDRLKMLGIGTGNSQYEVDFFRDHYSVPFALLPDADFAVNKGLGEVGTPYFMLLRLGSDGQHEILYHHEGAIEDKQAFYQDILKAGGLK